LDSESFDSFYRATAQSLVRYAYAMCGDLGTAQDFTQEAYIRAWQRWNQVSQYEHPEAWLRLVINRLVTDRWRWLGVRRRTPVHMRQTAVLPPPSDDSVVVVAALRRLPVPMRQVLVMHYLMDLPVSRIADELGIAINTVKSRLSRGRTGLAQVLGLNFQEVSNG
jgi:RNA polymerase sigma-70 factor (ECF subfamily)